jgi:multicomponent Na+:H+ antiporter subunit E
MRRIVHFIVALIVWLLLTWNVTVQNVIAGVIVAALSAALFGHLFPRHSRLMLNLRRVLWFLYYIPVFLIHCFKANLDVAYRVLHMNVPIRPGIVRVRTTLKSDMALTFLANSITLTPGTLTVDIIDNDMYIHWINVASDDPEEQTLIIVKRFEDILKRVFE